MPLAFCETDRYKTQNVYNIKYLQKIINNNERIIIILLFTLQLFTYSVLKNQTFKQINFKNPS